MKTELQKDSLTSAIEQQRADILALQKRIQKLKPRTSHPEKAAETQEIKSISDSEISHNKV